MKPRGAVSQKNGKRWEARNGSGTGRDGAWAEIGCPLWALEKLSVGGVEK